MWFLIISKMWFLIISSKTTKITLLHLRAFKYEINVYNCNIRSHIYLVVYFT